MAIRLLAGSLVLTPILVVALGACGGSGNDGNLFPTVVPDAAPAVAPYDGGSLFPTFDANDDAAAACTPVVLATSWKPVWKKPTTSAAGKCNGTQIQSFYEDCLLSPLTSAGCTAFVAANGDCSTCLQSDETDATYSAVIWHADRAYYTFNTAGCIANQENDDSATGCGAAYQAAVQCEETACNACGVADYALFPQCEQNAGNECETYLEGLNSACGPGLRDAADPAAECTLVTSAQAAWTVIAPIFCGSGT